MDLPTWMQECTTKDTSERYKSIIIHKFVISYTFYDDADVTLTSPLIKIIINRAWTGKDGNINRQENNTFLCVHTIIRPTGIQGWIPKPRFNNATQILPVRKQIPDIAQKRSSTTTTNKAERPTKQVKASPLTNIYMTTEEYDSYLKTKFKNSDTIPAEFPVRNTIGKSLLGLMCPNPP